MIRSNGWQAAGERKMDNLPILKWLEVADG
jgi:hypothetical protein